MKTVIGSTFSFFDMVKFTKTFAGHGKCVAFLKKFGVPLMLVGGGGYTIRNVSRCWTYETSVAVDTEIANGRFMCTITLY